MVCTGVLFGTWTGDDSYCKVNLKIRYTWHVKQQELLQPAETISYEQSKHTFQFEFL